MQSRNPLTIEIHRGNVVESSHQVMVVVADAQGRVAHSWGNINFLTPPRSAIKMIQALALAESGAMEKYDLHDKELALACASHGAEKEHLDVVRAWMEKLKLQPTDLACGPHLPFYEPAAHDLIRRNEKPSTLHNNCSGKHMGLITTCVHLKEPILGYEKYEHPSQVRMRKLLTEVMKVDHQKIPYGIDGCGIPTYAVPLQNIAVGMTVFLNPKEAELRKMAAKRILNAVTTQPQMIGGSDSFCSQVIAKSLGRGIAKVGAEGVYAGIIPEKGFAFAIKAIDGAKRAAEYATAIVLKTYGGLSDKEFQELTTYTQPVIKNWKGDVVGQIKLKKEG